MPELPEVETVVRDLRPQLSGRRVQSVRLARDPLILARLVRYPPPQQFSRRLRGCTIRTVERRGKYIMMPLNQNGQRLSPAGEIGAIGSIVSRRGGQHLCRRGMFSSRNPS